MTRQGSLSLRVIGAVMGALALVVSVLVAPAASATTPGPTAVVDSAIAPAAAPSLAGFKPGEIISDEVFFNSQSMNQAQIQTFLNSKVSLCDSGFVCLKNFTMTTTSRTADAYCDGYQGATRETAAQIIAKVAVSCGINPQVLLVTLQKEQNLVTSKAPTSGQYRIAMGQGCPDTAACDTRYYGFQNQVYGAARQFQLYVEGKHFTWYAPGKTWNIQYHPDKARCGTSPVYIANVATAALYYYTPYQPNAAATNAGWGTGDSCSNYGNRNFYLFMSDWFNGGTITAPGAPTGISAVAGNTQATVTWKAPTNYGWSPITGYTVTASPGGLTTTVAANATTATIKGLTNGTAYTFTVKANNVKGASAASGASAVVSPSAFTDIAGSAFRAEIEWMAAQRITTGYPVAGGKFEYQPYGKVTRDAMAAFLYRAAGAPTSYVAPAVSPFIDVPTSHPFYKEITWLASEGISTGWDTGGGQREYRPGLNITRDAMAVFLYRFAGNPAFTLPATSQFTDVPTTYVFYNEIAWMASTKVTTGWPVAGGKSEFRPGADITRDAMAAFLFRFTALPKG